MVKTELDRRVAVLLGKSLEEVGEITDAFLHEAVKAVVKVGYVSMEPLGVLYLNRRKNGSRVRYYVNFHRASHLVNALRSKFGGKIEE